MNVAAEVKKELEELKKLDVAVSDKALAYPEANAAEMDEYFNNGMKISEIADHVILLAR